MANKEALRELQTRLAQRMQVAKNEPAMHAWLAVECAGQGMLLPLEQAGEIFNAGRILTVPHTRPWFAGVANLRGGLHGVIDIAVFLGLEKHSKRRDHSLLVALNTNLNSHSAVLVEKLAGLRSAEQMSAEAADEKPRPEFAGARWKDAQDRVWQEIDLAALSRHEQFLAIAA